MCLAPALNIINISNYVLHTTWCHFVFILHRGRLNYRERIILYVNETIYHQYIYNNILQTTWCHVVFILHRGRLNYREWIILYVTDFIYHQYIKLYITHYMV